MSLDKSKRIVTLDIDIGAGLAGFDSAAKPTPAHHKVAGHFASPLLSGPPKSDFLMDMVLHMFTDEQADLVQYLPPLRARTAEKVARIAGWQVEDTRRILDQLAFTKRVILATGTPRKYAILPIVPGTFEMTLITTDLSTLTSWHKTFAHMFERLFETGYLADYPGRVSKEPVRYLPVQPIVKTLYMAWPSDKLEEILDPYDMFSVGHCQCRIAMQLIGKGCGKATENCLSIGPFSKPMIERGLMRQIDKQEAITIKRDAESQGSVTWMMNMIGDKRGNVSCSCCGCCCHGLRVVKDFSVPGLISRPHFTPKYDEDNCTLCEECVEICPMDAWTAEADELKFNEVRCIGCGLCETACEFDAVKMEAAKEAQAPTGNLNKLLLSMSPKFIANSFRVWAKRLINA